MTLGSVELDTSSKSRPNAKHVSKACLECRSRHMKCSGSQPCTRCEKLSKECSYVKSHRGGSRKKGVSKFDKKRTLKVPKAAYKGITPVSMSTDSDGSRSRNLHNSSSSISTTPSHITVKAEKRPSHNLGYYVPPVEDLIKLPCINSKKPANEVKKEYTDLLRMPCAFTCLEPQYKGKTPPCMGGKVRLSEERINLSEVPINATSSFYEKVNSTDYVKKLMSEIDVNEVIESYYRNFHGIHPLLPNKQDMRDYLNNVSPAYELILAMKIVSDAQSSSLYATDIETINFKVNQIFDYINTVVGIDLISVQTMALISLISHFSSLHDLSSRIRLALVKALVEQGYTMIDMSSSGSSENIKVSNGVPDSPESESDFDIKQPRKFLSSKRISKLPELTVMECARKVFWEVHFIDVIIGTADGRSISKLATMDMVVDYPHSVSPHIFDYKARAEGCQLVTEAIKLNVAVIDQAASSSSINHMNASLGNWEMRLSHPEMLNAPFMVDPMGHINEGVFQAMLLYNYARVFAHRPFSYLWKDAHPSDKAGVDKAQVESRKIIETRKTIEGATAVATCLLDTSASSINKRTPLYGCSVAFACLVHLSSYIWAKSTLPTTTPEDSVLRRSVEDELKVYAQLIQFELNTLLVISKHWMLAQKLSSYIKETIAKVTPELSDSLRSEMRRADNVSSCRVAIESDPHQEAPSVGSNISAVNTEPAQGRVLNFSESSSAFSGETNALVGNNNHELDEIDFTNYDFSAELNSQRMMIAPDSPMSDTGCDWIDRNVFEFDEEEFRNIMEGYDL